MSQPKRRISSKMTDNSSDCCHSGSGDMGSGSSASAASPSSSCDGDIDVDRKWLQQRLVPATPSSGSKGRSSDSTSRGSRMGGSTSDSRDGGKKGGAFYAAPALIIGAFYLLGALLTFDASTPPGIESRRSSSSQHHLSPLSIRRHARQRLRERERERDQSVSSSSSLSKEVEPEEEEEHHREGGGGGEDARDVPVGVADALSNAAEVAWLRKEVKLYEKLERAWEDLERTKADLANSRLELEGVRRVDASLLEAARSETHKVKNDARAAKAARDDTTEAAVKATKVAAQRETVKLAKKARLKSDGADDTARKAEKAKETGGISAKKATAAKKKSPLKTPRHRIGSDPGVERRQRDAGTKADPIPSLINTDAPNIADPKDRFLLPPTEISAWYDAASCNSDDEGTHSLTSVLNEIPLGTDKLPSWIEDICPEVAEHFKAFPAFSRSHFLSIGNETSELPILTTEEAVLGVCTVKFAQRIASSFGEKLFLHAGSHLGAVLHGQPLPWDDDFDALIRFEKRKKFLQACELSKYISPGVTLHCVRYHKCIKVWIQGPTSVKVTPKRYHHWSPFLDVFFYAENSTHVQEVKTWNKNWRESNRTKEFGVSIKKTDFYPTRPYYFGGIYALGSAEKYIFQHRSFYGKPRCIMSSYIHRLEQPFAFPAGMDRQLDCCRMSHRFPFLYHAGSNNKYVSIHIPAKHHECLTRKEPDGDCCSSYSLACSLPSTEEVEIGGLCEGETYSPAYLISNGSRGTRQMSIKLIKFERWNRQKSADEKLVLHLNGLFARSARQGKYSISEAGLFVHSTIYDGFPKPPPTNTWGYQRTARFLAEKGPIAEDSPICLSVLSYENALANGEFIPMFRRREAGHVSIKNTTNNFLIALTGVKEDQILCGISRNAGTNLRVNSGCGCMENAKQDSAMTFLFKLQGNYTSRLVKERTGQINWGKCQPGGSFWCDQIPEADVDASFDSSCTSADGVTKHDIARPECGSSFCAWRANQGQEFIKFQQRILRSKTEGSYEGIEYEQKQAALEPNMEGVISDQSHKFNEVLMSHTSFYPSIAAVLIPEESSSETHRRGKVAAEVISTTLQRRVPALFIAQDLKRLPDDRKPISLFRTKHF